MLLDISYVFDHGFLFWIASGGSEQIPLSAGIAWWFFLSFGVFAPALLRQSHDISHLYTDLSTYNELGNPARLVGTASDQKTCSIHAGGLVCCIIVVSQGIRN